MTAVLAKFDYSYTHGGKTISFKIGDRFSLINKANADWWHVKRCSVNGGVEEIYVPVLYVEEVADNPSYSTQSLDRRITHKNSNDSIGVAESIVESPLENEQDNIYENLKPAPPPPQPKERTPQPRGAEKKGSLPRTLSGSTFGTTISPKEFSENLASPPLVSPIRSTPSPPFVPPKPVSRAGSSDRIIEPNVTSPTGPPPVKARTLSTYKKHRNASTPSSNPSSNPTSNTLEEPGETSTFMSRSLPSGQNSFPPKRVNRTISAEPTALLTSNSVGIANGSAIGPPITTVANAALPSVNTNTTASIKPQPPSSTSSNEEEDALPDGWKQYHTPDGTPYYYNENTKQSSWSKPAIPKAKRSIPAGWKKETNAFGVTLYINTKTNEKWGLGQGDAGKYYFYNTANASQIMFELPEVLDGSAETINMNGGVVNNTSPVHHLSIQPDNNEESSERPRASSDVTALQPQLGKKDLTPQPPPVTATTATASSNAQTMSYVSHLSNDVSNRHGYLYRKRIFDSAGKKLRGNWTYHYVMLQDGMLSFFKDLKTARETPSAKPQSMFSLLYGSVSIPTTNVKRKNVFQVSSSFGEQFYLQADTPQMLNDWYASLQASIKRIQDEKGTDMVDYSPASHRNSKIRHSMVVNGSDSDEEVDTEMIDTSTGQEKSVRIKSRLRRLIAKRPQAETLRNQGIILDSVFGCDLTKLVEAEGSAVPKFLVRCMEEIEKRGLDVTGIYRLSGNAAQIQKLRHRTDQDLPVDFGDQEWEDINIISGALKLFLRELPDPLIPFSLYNKFIEAGKLQPAQKIGKLKSCVKELPKANYQTLKILSNHLRKVMEYSAENKMQSTNLAIVFGPTIMRSEVDSLAIASLMPIQSRVMEAFLTDYDTIFGKS